MPLTLGWYFHLPPCASAFEVDTVVHENLYLLLDAHREAHARVSVAVTGSLLARMEGRHDDCLEMLSRAVSDGTVELLGTAYHEVCPFLIPPHYLRQQIELDLSIKQRLFGSRPVAFWPGNFAWSPVLAYILSELGVRTVIVDEAHLREARQTQLWHWLTQDSLRMDSALVDTVMSELLTGWLFRLQQSPDISLLLRVQSAAVRRQLSFGTTGAIHRAWDDERLEAVVAGLDASGCIGERLHAFSGDDGDRVNPISIHQYRKLLSRVGPSLEHTSAPHAAEAAEVLDFLPAHAPGGMEFWSDSVVAAYLRVLDALYRQVDLGRIRAEEVLPLQDVFPIFWKRIARARWFYEQAWELLRRADGSHCLSGVLDAPA